ncbi:DUF4249 domain-containing protein [Maribacter spongiicola]|uniref:DUF4249 domain-containing protein n=1 Tax=Maribacter spongiicola TaxID=1206753 RepID=UPI003F9AF294
MQTIKQIVVMLIMGLLMQNCIDPFEIETTEFKSALVIEGTITDQLETQRILVSRTFPLDTVLMTGLSSAKVNVVDSNGGVFSFSEASSGEYESNSPFAAISGVSYTLKVETADGNSYTSEETAVPAKTNLDNLYAVRDFKDNGAEEGMFIYVDSYDATGQSKYYRYEYEETYKIIAPNWSASDAYIVSPLPSPEVATRSKTKEEQVAYNTVLSNSIIQENTTDLGEDRINKFPVRFINRENFILSHRYSILVKQFVQNRAAYSYYETLQLLSGTESLFSQRQSGFLEGNIKSDTNADEDVVGFFQVSTVTEKRIFFNYTDFFPGENLPKYPVDCTLVSPPIINEAGASPLLVAIELEILKYVEDYDQETNPLSLSEFGPFLMVAAPCGNSTFYGSAEVPEFWVE